MARVFAPYARGSCAGGGFFCPVPTEGKPSTGAAKQTAGEASQQGWHLMGCMGSRVCSCQCGCRVALARRVGPSPGAPSRVKPAWPSLRAPDRPLGRAVVQGGGCERRRRRRAERGGSSWAV